MDQCSLFVCTKIVIALPLLVTAHNGISSISYIVNLLNFWFIFIIYKSGFIIWFLSIIAIVNSILGPHNALFYYIMSVCCITQLIKKKNFTSCFLEVDKEEKLSPKV